MKTALTLTLALAGATFAAQAQEIKGDAARGATLNATCIGCHGIAGYQASFPEVYRVPAISGQNDKYIIAALNAYKKGERKHPTMRAVAVSLTEQDIADLAACHGENFNKPLDGSYPKIAGQYPDYLFNALKSYKVEGNANVGRGNAIMSAQAKQFSNAELKAIAQFLGSLPTDVHTVAQSKFR